MYSSLKSEAIVKTIERLNRRIHERFPESSLGKVNTELLGLARAAQEKADALARPWTMVRLAEALLCASLVVGILYILTHSRVEGVFFDLAYLVQVLEPAANLVVLLGIALLSVAGIERRMKRARAIAAINQLRAIAHIIDMHQLTKDPERPLGRQSTPSSPTVKLTPFQLRRYLDYCSEMLSLTAKVATLFAQSFSDPVVLSAVNEMESLTTGLSRKVWQKVMVQQGLSGGDSGVTVVTAPPMATAPPAMDSKD